MSERAIAIKAKGRVQGVNYRNFVSVEARKLGVRGWVVNCDDGSVDAALHGPGEALGRLVELCRDGPPDAKVEAVDVRSIDLGLVDEPPPNAYPFSP